MRPEVEARHLTLDVGGTTIHFFNYNSLADNAERVDAMRMYFERMPVAHLAAVYPVLLIGLHPTRGVGDHAGTSGGGGTPRPSELRGLRRNSARTGAPEADVDEIIAELSGGHRLHTVHFIPEHKWAREEGPRAFTLFHEVGHGVDYELHLTRARGGVALTVEDFPGDINLAECGGSASYEQSKRAAISYSHAIVRQRVASRTIIESFRRSLAFRGVPDAWFETIRA